MPVKRKNGPYRKCDWCQQLPDNKKTYVHTNITNDPPQHFFCKKSCLESWIFQDNHRIITNFSNMNKLLFINTQFIYKENVR